MNQISPLQKARAAYAPKLPPALAHGAMVRVIEGAPTTAVADVEKIREIFKTTFGYRLRAVGFNRDAARYAGISSKRNIILSFVVGGLLAGLGGACFYLLGNAQYTYNISSVDQMGFDAIPIALLANNNPIGILFTTFFISFIKVSGIGLQGVGTYNDKFAEIMIALILYGSAFAVLINTVFLKGGRTLKKGKKKKEGKENGNA